MLINSPPSKNHSMFVSVHRVTSTALMYCLFQTSTKYPRIYTEQSYYHKSIQLGLTSFSRYNWPTCETANKRICARKNSSFRFSGRRDFLSLFLHESENPNKLAYSSFTHLVHLFHFCINQILVVASQTWHQMLKIWEKWERKDNNNKKEGQNKRKKHNKANLNQMLRPTQQQTTKKRSDQQRAINATLLPLTKESVVG